MDAAGNRVARVHGVTETYSYDPHMDVLRTVLRSAGFSWDTTSYGYGSKGEQISEIHTVPFTRISGGILDTAKEDRRTSASYTAGLMTSSTYTLDTIPGVPPHYKIYQRKESYRYDAFGRRVWVELVRDTNCTTHDMSSDCSNYVRRVYWDGDQILQESQIKADTGKWDPIEEGGDVTYVHGGTVDQPLEVYKSGTNIVVPYVNWRGQFVTGTCPLAYCSGITFPLSDASAYDDIQDGSVNGTWFGTLIKGQIDASGYEYKRNRYYNPSSGRFTQEDPIGLAGGLNVYGYANGDPASYSDPFGLCTPRWLCGAIDDMRAGFHSYLQRMGLEPAGESISSRSSRAFALGELTAQITLGMGVAETQVPEAASDALSLSRGIASDAPGTVGWGGRELSSAENSEFRDFGDRARSVGLEENANRTGSWGRYGSDGKFREVARIDVGKEGASGYEGQTHIHLNGAEEHLPVSTPIPGEQ